MSNKVKKADNQQATHLKNRWGASETTRGAPLKKEALQAYLQGALHDGTLSSNKRFRFSQKGTELSARGIRKNNPFLFRG